MNKDRRNRIDAALALVVQAREALDDVAGEEREAFDAMPEGLQNSERGGQSGEAAEALEQAVASLEEIENDLQPIVEG